MRAGAFAGDSRYSCCNAVIGVRSPRALRSRNRAIRRQRDANSAQPVKVTELPRSATSFALAVAAMIAGLGSIWLLAPEQHLDVGHFVAYLPLVPCLAVVLVIAVAEWVAPRLRAASPGALATKVLRPLDLQRVVVRLCGLIATLALIAFLYWLFPGIQRQLLCALLAIPAYDRPDRRVGSAVFHLGRPAPAGSRGRVPELRLPRARPLEASAMAAHPPPFAQLGHQGVLPAADGRVPE